MKIVHLLIRIVDSPDRNGIFFVRRDEAAKLFMVKAAHDVADGLEAYPFVWFGVDEEFARVGGHGMDFCNYYSFRGCKCVMVSFCGEVKSQVFIALHSLHCSSYM